MSKNTGTSELINYFDLGVNGDVGIAGSLDINTIANATTDTDTFLVSDTGIIKYRTGAQLLSDIGAAPAVAGGYVPYTGATTNVDLGVYNLTASAIIANGSGSNSGIVHLESNAIHSLVNGYGSIASGTTNQFNLYQTTGAGVFRGAILSLNSITEFATRTFTLPDADGTLALTSQIPANPVGGTGTAGQVTYWSSSSEITGISNFLFNASERNLTIDRSLSTLGNAITISKGSDVDQAWLAFRQGGGASGVWRLGYSGDPYDFRISAGSDSSLGTQALRIFEDSQNVVVGTAIVDNGTKLQVGGSVNIVGNGSQLLFDSLGQSKSGGIYYTNDFELLINNSRGVGSAIYLGNVNMDFHTNVSGNPRLRIESNGNLGIGTSTPTSSFNARLAIRNEDAANNPTLVLFKNINSASSEDIFRVQSWNGAFNTVASIRANGSASFSSSVTSNATTSVSFYSGTYVSNSLGDGSFATYSGRIRENLSYGLNIDLYDRTAATWRTPLSFNNTGGVATFSSSATVSAYFQSSGTTPYWVFQSTGAGGTGYLGFGASLISGSAATDFILRSDNVLKFAVGNSNSMVINASGNVGIGTVSPNSKFEIQGSTSSPQFRISRSEQTNQGLTIQAGGGVTLLDSYDGTDTVFGSYTFNSTKGTNTVTRMRIDGSGNVGINTNNPSGQLSGTKGLSIVDSVNAAFGLSNGTNHWLNYLSGTTYRIWNNSVAEVMTLMYNGNVLIGTTTDNGNKFQVSGITYSTNYISGTQGLNVSGYGFLTQTISGQMTILGHNISASNSVANQVNVVNGGWFSSMIKMYYSEGITFHTSSTSYSAGAVYPIDATERIRIKSNGEVIFHNSIILRNGQINSLTSSDSGQSMYLNFQGNGAIYAGSSYTVLYAGSDERIKTEINHSQSTLTKILNLIPRTFKYKERPEVTNYGFIAQEVEAVMPELVRTSEGITMCLDEQIENQKSVESYGLAWASILVKAIQEQQQQIQELKNKLS